MLVGEESPSGIHILGDGTDQTFGPGAMQERFRIDLTGLEDLVQRRAVSTQWVCLPKGVILDELRRSAIQGHVHVTYPTAMSSPARLPALLARRAPQPSNSGGSLRSAGAAAGFKA